MTNVLIHSSEQRTHSVLRGSRKKVEWTFCQGSKAYLLWRLSLHFPGDGLNVVTTKLLIGLDKLLEVTLGPVGETLIQFKQTSKQSVSQSVTRSPDQ